MSHGTTDIDTPRDHTREQLRAAATRAGQILAWARENVREAERNLELARLAEERASERLIQADQAWRAHEEAGRRGM